MVVIDASSIATSIGVRREKRRECLTETKTRLPRRNSFCSKKGQRERKSCQIFDLKDKRENVILCSPPQASFFFPTNLNPSSNSTSLPSSSTQTHSFFRASNNQSTTSPSLTPSPSSSPS